MLDGISGTAAWLWLWRGPSRTTLIGKPVGRVCPLLLASESAGSDTARPSTMVTQIHSSMV
eukprot:366097-Chlamydomonas_euryale.AAC.52